MSSHDTNATMRSSPPRSGRGRRLGIAALAITSLGLLCCSALIDGELDGKPSKDDPTTTVTGSGGTTTGGGAGATGGGGGTGLAGGGGSGGVSCGSEPSPPGGNCTGWCTNGCAGNLCAIDCTGGSVCRDTTLNCPAGFACSVACSGPESCRGATINCPDEYSCDITCIGDSACQNLTVQCSATGTCATSCNTAEDVCLASQVACGQNACTATCASDSHPNLSCGSSCYCQEC